MKKIFLLLLILIFLPVETVSANQIDSTQIIMEEGEAGDTVRMYLIPPTDNNLGGVFIELRFNGEILEYIDSEFLNASGLDAEISLDHNSVSIMVTGLKNKTICLMVFLKLKKYGDPSFYLSEEYFDKSYRLIDEHSGYASWKTIEKNAEIPIEIEPSYSEIEIFIRDKYVLLAGEHDMSGTIWVSAYDALGNLIDITSFKPSNRITTKPYSKASFVKIMWWDKRTFAPVCHAKKIVFE